MAQVSNWLKAKTCFSSVGLRMSVSLTRVYAIYSDSKTGANYIVIEIIVGDTLAFPWTSWVQARKKKNLISLQQSAKAESRILPSRLPYRPQGSSTCLHALRPPTQEYYDPKSSLNELCRRGWRWVFANNDRLWVLRLVSQLLGVCQCDVFMRPIGWWPVRLGTKEAKPILWWVFMNADVTQWIVVLNCYSKLTVNLFKIGTHFTLPNQWN